MQRSLKFLALFFVALGSAWPLGGAWAQNLSATVVASCGTPPTTYTAGQSFPLTMDTTGKLCDGGGGGGGGGAVSIADGADVAEGSRADLAWVSGSGTTISLLKNIALGVAGSVPAGTATIGALVANQSVNTAQVNGVNTLTGAGATGTGAQRVTASQDTSTIAGSAPGTAGSASANVVTVQGVASMTKILVTPDSVALPANQSVNTAQVNGVNTLTGTGAVGTGSQRVAVGTDTATIAGSAPSTVLLANTTTPYPSTAVPITASTTGTTGATTATLTAVNGHTTYICGFSIRANATAAATGNATVTGTISNTLNFTQWTAPAASGLGINEQVMTPCVPASAVSTNIAVISAAPGTGGVVSVTAWGYSI